MHSFTFNLFILLWFVIFFLLLWLIQFYNKHFASLFFFNALIQCWSLSPSGNRAQGLVMKATRWMLKRGASLIFLKLVIQYVVALILSFTAFWWQNGIHDVSMSKKKAIRLSVVIRTVQHLSSLMTFIGLLFLVFFLVTCSTLPVIVFYVLNFLSVELFHMYCIEQRGNILLKF